LVVALVERGEGSSILIGNVRHGQLDVLERRLGVGVPHHFLQHGKSHASARHVGAEGMAEAVSVGRGEQGELAAMAKEGAQASGSQGAAAAGSLQHEEQAGRVGASGALDGDVLAKGATESFWQGNDALTAAFAADADLVVVETHVAHFEADDFASAQTAEQHEIDDGEISVASDPAEERFYLVWCEWLDEGAGLLDPQLQRRAPVERVKSEITVTSGTLVVRAWKADVFATEVTSAMESIEQADGAQAAVDGAWGGITLALGSDEQNEIGSGELVKFSI